MTRSRSIGPALLASICLAFLANPLCAGVQAAQKTFVLKPSTVDPDVHVADAAHIVIYDPQVISGKLLVWLPGTNEQPESGPRQFYEAAVAQGYRLVALSYIDTPAVAQTCTARQADPDCAAKFREKRVFGSNVTSVIKDEPQDAVVHRLVQLLRYLSSTDPGGHWASYLHGDAPRWSEIAVAGQSQGGGMAAFIAKRETVARVIMFSGGWDQQSPGVIAGWYASPGATPANLLYGTYHVREANARLIAEIYTTLGLPQSHIVPFDLPVPPGRDAHGQGIRNPAYAPSWIALLGRGDE